MTAPPASLSAQRRCATAALSGFGLKEAATLTALRGLSRRAVFRVDTEPGGGGDTRYVLHGYPQGVADLTPIRSVLEWQEALVRDAGLGVPAPQRAIDDDLLVVTEADPETGQGARCWSLVRWLDGRPLNRPYGEARLERVGAFVARLHLHAGRWVPPELLEALLTLKRLRSLPSLARWTGHARAGVANWAREQLGERLALLRSAWRGDES
jgi:Ser/Thr protein kinase RdoA (MazF antagonist)